MKLKLSHYKYIITVCIFTLLLSITAIAGDDITTVDLTTDAASGSVSHQHIYIDKYDSTYHWKECSICGLVKGAKIRHTFKRKDMYIDSRPCYPGNYSIYTCDCGYSYQSSVPHTAPSTIRYYPTGAQRHVHYYSCTVCGCWMWSSGCDVSCAHPGRCSKCGQVVTSDDHHIERGVCTGCGVRFYDSKLTKFYYPSANRCIVEITSTTYHGFKWKEAPSGNFSHNIQACYKTYTKRMRVSGNTYVFTYDYTLDPNSARETSLYYGDGLHGTVNGHDVYVTEPLNYNPSERIKADRTAPSNISATVRLNENVNGWALSAVLNVSGKDVGGATYVDIKVLDDTNKSIYNGRAMKNGQNFSLSVTPPLEASGSRTYTVICTDQLGNETKTRFTISNVDAAPPEYISSTDFSNGWSQYKDVVVKAKDNGSGEVEIAFDNPTSPATGFKKATKISGNTWQRTFRMTGELYEKKDYKIFLRDKVGNVNTITITIGYLDNTKPKITDLVPKDNGSSWNLNVSEDDYNERVKKQGSGAIITLCNETPVNGLKNLAIAPNAYTIRVKDQAGNVSDPEYIGDVKYTMFGGTLGDKPTVYSSMHPLVLKESMLSGYDFVGWTLTNGNKSLNISTPVKNVSVTGLRGHVHLTANFAKNGKKDEEGEKKEPNITLTTEKHNIFRVNQK